MKKIAIVTGSSRGIGRGIADMLYENGYQVIYSGTKAERPENLPADRDYFPCNIAEKDQREKLIDYALASYGRIDVLVNNAGVAPLVRKDILEMEEESFDRVLGINLKGTFFLCQLAANAMLKGKETLSYYAPRIINIGSISAYTSSTSRGEYCISKSGLSMVTTLFADRLAEYNIPVFEVRPGIIRTDMTSTVTEKYDKLIAEGVTPIKRWGEPEDIAKAVHMLSQELLPFSTGEVINVDGGFHLQRL